MRHFILGCLMIAFSSVGATTFEMPPAGEDIIGHSFSIKARGGDTLASVGEDFGIGFHEMEEANPGINKKRMREGQHVVIPAAYILPRYREGIVINIAEVRLYYFTKDGKYVHTYPVGLGRAEWRTPIADTKVVRKKIKPTWYVPDSIRDFVFEQTGNLLPDSIPPGPENPLGPFAIYLQKSGYLIHGTNQPWTIGKLISSGCVRMHNADVEELYNLVQVGDPVRIVHYPYKVGWKNNVMYIESHVPVNLKEPTNNLNVVSVDEAIQKATQHRQANIEWKHVDVATHENRGMPYAIGNYH